MSEPTLSVAESRTFDTWQGGVIIGTVLCTAVAYSVHLLSFLHVKVAVLGVLLVVVALVRVGRGVAPLGGLKAFLPLWVFLGWCFVLIISGRWASVAIYSWVELIRLASLVLLATLSFEVAERPLWRAHFFTALSYSSVIVGALGLLQYMRLVQFLFPEFPGYDQPMYSVFGNQDLFGGYVAMGLPMVVHSFLKHQRRELRLLTSLFILIPALLLSGSRSAWLAAAVGTAIVVIFGRWDARRLLVLALSAAVVSLLLIFLVPETTIGRVFHTFGADDVGGRARLWIWDGTFRMIASAPILGIGLGQFAYLSPYFLGQALIAEGGERHYHNELQTLHAHSDPLEILAETGAIGVLLVLWMLSRLWKARGREWGPLVTLLVFSCFNATYQSAPHALCILLLMACLVARKNNSREFGVSLPWQAHLAGSAGIVVLALFFAVVTITTVTLPSAEIRAADAARERGEDAEEAYAAYEALTEHPWARYMAYEALGAIALEEERYDDAVEYLGRASRGIDTGRLWLYKGIAEEMRGDSDVGRALYERCLSIWPDNLEAWERLVPLLSPEERAVKEQEALRWLPGVEVERLFGGTRSLQ